MQSKKLPILAAVFGIQILIAGALFMRSNEPVTAVNEPLVQVDASAVNKLEIQSQEGTLSLTRNGDQWQLANGLPAQSSQVTDLLETIYSLKTRWPVANTEGAAERFEVADDKFQRKVRLLSGESELAMFYLGSSPGFNQSHVRLPGENAIYALPINGLDAQVDNDHWLDSSLLQPTGDVQSVTSVDYQFTKTGEEWLDASGDGPVAAAEEQPNEDPAEARNADEFDIGLFVQMLNNLRVAGIAEGLAEFDVKETQSADDSQSMQVIRWKVKTASEQYEYSLLKKDEEYYMRRNDYSQTFRVTKTQYEGFSKIVKNSLDVAQTGQP